MVSKQSISSEYLSLYFVLRIRRQSEPMVNRTRINFAVLQSSTVYLIFTCQGIVILYPTLSLDKTRYRKVELEDARDVCLILSANQVERPFQSEVIQFSFSISAKDMFC